MSDLSHGSPSEQSKPADRQRRDWLVNALIPALAALTGALIGAAVSVFITIYQINASQHQTVDTFLRSQRQSSYATLLTDSYELEHSSARLYYSGTRDDNNMNSLITKVAVDYYNIAVLGPSDVASGSSKIFVDASCIGEDNRIGTYGFKCGHTSIEDLNKLAKDIGDVNHDMTRVIENN